MKENNVEKRALESKLLYETIFEQSPDGILLIDTEGAIIDFNEAAHRQLGYTREEFSRLRISDIDPIQDPEEIQTSIREILEKGHATFDVKHRTKSGELRDVCVITKVLNLSGRTLFHTIWRDTTEQTSALAKVAEEKAWSESVIAAIGDAISIQDTHFKVVYQNKTHKSIMGDRTGEYCYEAYEKKAEVCDDCPVSKSFLDGQIHRTERSVRFPEGVRHFDIISSPLRDAAGRIIAGIEVVRDITDRVQAESSLQASEKLLRTIVDTEPECVKLLTREGVLITMNPAGLAMIEAESLDLVKGKEMCSLVAPEYREAFARLNKDIFSGKTGRLEFAVTGLKGRRLWLETNAVPLRNERDEIFALLGITRDITKRKHAETELREKEEHYRVLFNAITDSLFVHEVKEDGSPGTFLEVNNVACERLGYTRQELLAMSPLDIDAPNPGADVKEIGRRVLAGESVTFEQTHMAKDGRRIAVEINAQSFMLGKHPVVLSLARDITERKRYEAELLRVQKLESLGILAGGIAHDFNNLLMGIFGYISLAKLKAEPSVGAYLEKAEKTLDQAKGLTQQLLTFSKGGEPIKRTLRLAPIIRDAVGLALSGSNVNAEFSLPQDLKAAEADGGQLTQVIQNIVINAVEAMPLGGTLSVTARNEMLVKDIHSAKATEYVAIAFKDQGVGIPREYIPRIFDPFFTTKSKGNGLGLASSHSIVTRHGGRMEVSSEPGKGSEFTIYLPASGKVGITRTPADEELVYGKGRILVLEDEDIVTLVCRDILMTLGYEAEFVTVGEEVLKKYLDAMESGSAYDIVILDLTVRGGMGGRETMKGLLKLDPHVKVIVSSGYAEDPVMANFRDYGFKAMLAKPYKVETISKALHELMFHNS